VLRVINNFNGHSATDNACMQQKCPEICAPLWGKYPHFAVNLALLTQHIPTKGSRCSKTQLDLFSYFGTNYQLRSDV